MGGILQMKYQPYPDEGLSTHTSDDQNATEALLKEVFDVWRELRIEPTLLKQEHLQYLIKNIKQLPAPLQALDASKPWLMYWTLHSMSLLGGQLDPASKARAVETILKYQNATGGFGGGVGQLSHVLSTYSAVMALAICGESGPNGGWDSIDREAIYNWFMTLKQPDGSFIVHADGEIDVRGIYCIVTVSAMLDMLTPELVDGTYEYLASCQTYEGGFSSASYPTTMGKILPLGEAHGGYSSCAFASLWLLRPFSKSTIVDLKRLRRWAVSLQGGASDGGGFRGRTGKLVDGCYSWWCGSLFPILDAWLKTPSTQTLCYDRVALQEYILIAAQKPSGGLRDKPGKSADSYHTTYVLAGLSAAQNEISYDNALVEKWHKAWQNPQSTFRLQTSRTNETRRRTFVDMVAWKENESKVIHIGPVSANSTNAAHPIFNVVPDYVEAMAKHFYRIYVGNR